MLNSKIKAPDGLSAPDGDFRYRPPLLRRDTTAHDLIRELIRALKVSRCFVAEAAGNDAIKAMAIIDIALSKARGLQNG